jgi:hypothetical protein
VSGLLERLEKAQAAIHRGCKADNPRCACLCGCEERIGCACFSLLCLDCHMAAIRGRDPEPGRPACDFPPSDGEGGG